MSYLFSGVELCLHFFSRAARPSWDNAAAWPRGGAVPGDCVTDVDTVLGELPGAAENLVSR
jgi:hypothetical protein